MNAVKTLCGWCGVLICDGELVDGRVSHGICITCRDSFEEEI